MSVVYCSANHSPEQLLSWMSNTFGLDSDSDFYICDSGKKLSIKNANNYSSRIIFLSYRDAKRNMDLFNHKHFKKNQFFVFAPPFRCAEIGNSVWLDFENNPEYPGISYRLTGWKKEKYDPKFFRGEKAFYVREGFREKVIDNVKDMGSIMSGLQTVVYSLPQRQMQKAVTRSMCEWMYSGGSEEELDATLAALKLEMSLTQRKVDKFRDLMLGEDGQKVQDAFAYVRERKAEGQSVSFKTVGAKFFIHDFDLRYISKIVRTESEYEDLEDVTITEFYERVNIKAEEKKAQGISDEDIEAGIYVTDEEETSVKAKSKTKKRKSNVASKPRSRRRKRKQTARKQRT